MRQDENLRRFKDLVLASKVVQLERNCFQIISYFIFVEYELLFLFKFIYQGNLIMIAYDHEILYK